MNNKLIQRRIEKYVVNITTNLLNKLLIFLMLCGRMKVVEMTKTKTKNKRLKNEEKETIKFSGRKGNF